jgi:hypothetical protein
MFLGANRNIREEYMRVTQRLPAPLGLAYDVFRAVFTRVLCHGADGGSTA